MGTKETVRTDEAISGAMQEARQRRASLRLVGGALLLGVTLAVAPLLAQETVAAVKRVSDKITYAPTAVPDRIILTLTDDPARSQAVTWRTDTSVAPGQARVQVVEAAPRPGLEKSAATAAAETAPFASDLGDAHTHSARLTGLKPDTLYAYRVGDGANWSDWAQFRTAADKPGAAFSFLYLGDAQNDIRALWSRAARAAYRGAPQARFVLHAGDLINTKGNDGQWGEWFAAARDLHQSVPSVPTPGNHEYGVGALMAPKSIDPHWRPQFGMPVNGPAGLEETCYYLDYQGVRIISLNSEEKQAEQARWLDDLLAKNPHRWTVLTFHRPLYSSAKGRDNKELRDLWLPVFDKHKVDLVLQGHDHTYARSKKLRAGRPVGGGDAGTVYVVTVSGPKMYELDREPWMQRAAEDTQFYQTVSVDGDTLRYEAYTVTGELYDAFDLKKSAPGANTRLTERAPKTPERLRPRGAAAPGA